MRTSPTGNQTGFTLLEVLMAITVSMIVVTASYTVFHTAMSARRKSLAAIAPLKEARFAFATLARDLRALHPDVKPEDVVCRERLCRFPILDARGERQWIRYRLQKDALLREIFDPQLKSGATSVDPPHIVAADQLEDASFGANQPKTAPGVSALPRSIDLKLVFRGPAAATYNYKVLLETQPESSWQGSFDARPS